MPPQVKGETLRKLQPKLRMIADGGTTVNIVRAERCAALSVAKPELLKKHPPVRGVRAVGVARKTLKKLKAPRLKKIVTFVHMILLPALVAAMALYIYRASLSEG